MINSELIDSAYNRIFLYHKRVGPLSFYVICEYFGADWDRNQVPHKKIYLRKKPALEHYATFVLELSLEEVKGKFYKLFDRVQKLKKEVG